MRCAWCDADLSGLQRVYVIAGYPDPRPAFGSVSCHNFYKQLWTANEPIPLLADRRKPHRCPVGPKLVVANSTVGRDFPPRCATLSLKIVRTQRRHTGNFTDRLLTGD